MFLRCKIIAILMALAITPSLAADGDTPGDKVTVSGYVKDAENGEALIGATVSIKDLKTGTATNQYGFFSLSLKPGNYILEFRYIGYALISRNVDLSKSLALDIELLPEQKQLKEVVITTEKPDANVKKAEMSVSKLEIRTIKQVPALMGEVDVIKVIQMLPGVQTTAEGTSGFSVRGGGTDQNLILIDEATVYNASHLMGFFSVFNNDAIRDVKLYKGDIPASYGGRLSSVLDVRMKEGNNKRLSATGGLGLISSRLTLEGPIGSEKTSFLVSGRRTYADLFFPLLTDTSAKNSKMFFYDLNVKVNHQINKRNRLFLSGYAGRDKFGQKGNSDAGFGNMTGTLRWNHLFSDQLFANITAIVAKYDYSLTMKFAGADYVWKSMMQDYSLKADFNYFLNPQNELKFGASSTYHYFDPCNAYIDNGTSIGFKTPKLYALEHGIYLSNQQKIGEKLTLKYGLRYTLFQNMGNNDTLLSYSYGYPNYKVADKKYYKKGDIFHSYNSLEPRIGAVYELNNKSSIKASYSRTAQYMQLASNSTGGMPLDVWFPSSPNVKPQIADQYAIGYFRNFSNNLFETSVEAYYKDMENVIDFKDNVQLIMNARLEGDVRVGSAKAYGLEFLVRKNEGRFYGWISYTLSKVKRKIPDINYGNEYVAPYDKPHNINVIVNYELSPRLIISSNWIYATGAPITFPDGTYEIDNTILKHYSNRNGSRMRDYHRLDLSVTLKGKDRPGRLWQGEWVFSIYNLYGRHNDWMLNFTQDSKNQNEKVEKQNNMKIQRYYLPFVYFPGITYNFKF